MKTTFWLMLTVLFLAAATEVSSQPAKPIAGAFETEKVACPKGEELVAARKKVRDVFATDFKQAKFPEQRWQLATKLAKNAAETRDDPESEYAISMEAIDLCVGVGDALSAFRAVDELVMTFQIDPISTKTELLKRAAKEAKAVPLKRMMAVIGLKLAGDASAAEQYVAAKELATLSLGLAKPSRDPSVIKRASEQQLRLAEMLKVWQKVSEAREKLKTDADDPTANEAVGRYLCLVRQSWDEGMPALAKGANLELKTLAKLDLNVAVDADATAQAEVGDAWWRVVDSRKAKDPEKAQLILRVAFWYEKAIGGLTGLKKAEAEKRLETAYEVMSRRNFRKDMENAANGIQSQGVVDCAENCIPAEMGKSFDYRSSWLLSLQFKPPHLSGGWHMVMLWGDGRPGHDALWLRQDGPWLHCFVEDCVNERGQGISAPLAAKQINEWVDLKFVHDAVSQELELYIDNRLIRKEALAIVPQPDQEMNVVLGGTNSSPPQRFTGQARNVWFGNIK
jgi:hypothetical protein